MKKVLVTIVAGVLAMTLVTPVLAQAAGPKKGTPPAGGPGGKNGERRMMGLSQEMMTKLKITEAQKKKLEALSKDLMAKMQKLRNEKLTEEERRKRMRTMMEAHRAEMNKIFTAEQRKILEAEMKKMREKREKEGGRQGRPGGNGGARPPL